MADVSFNEEPSYAPAYGSVQNKTGISALVIKMGLAKTEQQAQGVLIGVVVACVLIAGGVLFFMRRDVPPPQAPGSQSWPKPVAPTYRR